MFIMGLRKQRPDFLAAIDIAATESGDGNREGESKEGDFLTTAPKWVQPCREQGGREQVGVVATTEWVLGAKTGGREKTITGGRGETCACRKQRGREQRWRFVAATEWMQSPEGEEKVWLPKGEKLAVCGRRRERRKLCVQETDRAGAETAFRCSGRVGVIAGGRGEGEVAEGGRSQRWPPEGEEKTAAGGSGEWGDFCF